MEKVTNLSAAPYKLKSVKSGKIFDDKGWQLDPPDGEGASLIRAIYEEVQLVVGAESDGLFKFRSWLPVLKSMKGSSAPVTYKSEGLSSVLGLRNLWITFSGYWPEKGAQMSTCSFKETEAYSVCGRMGDGLGKVLVVASAGNTARAFAKVCSDNKIPLLLCVPEDNLDSLWFDGQLDECVRLVCTRRGSDYFDAIHLSNIIVSFPGFIAEGGAKNVARRDGMGTTVLSAVTTIGTIPKYYFQAVGSGTGAIAAWEANLRFIEDGRFGSQKMQLMVSQNSPFHPIYDAWKASSRDILPMDDDHARHCVNIMDAKVLSNRKPPYSIVGGLFDALKDTDGDVSIVTNEESRCASRLFKDVEGIDIHPAAAVAVASLSNEVSKGRIHADDLIMLNITGGGEALFKAEKNLYYLKPDYIFDINPSVEKVDSVLKEIFSTVEVL